MYWRYLYLNYNEMRYENVLSYIEDYIEDENLKLKGPFHILEVTFRKQTYLRDFNYVYCCPNNKKKSLHA